MKKYMLKRMKDRVKKHFLFFKFNIIIIIQRGGRMPEYLLIYLKIKNDIDSSINNEIHYVNQMGKINTPNDSLESLKDYKHKIGTKYINGGVVEKHDDSYRVSYNFDFGMEFTPRLLFYSYHGDAGVNLHSFIKELSSASPSIFVIMDGFIPHDIRKEICKIKEIQIKNTDINYNLTKVIATFFPNLETLKFLNCTILQDASFKNINADIEFNSSNILSTLCFRETKSNIKLNRSNIFDIYPININSSSLELGSIGKNYTVNIQELFLKCNFPNLKELRVSSEASNPEYSYEKSFMYLPFSAPNLEKVYISGKVYSFDFLRKLKYLVYASVESIIDYDDVNGAIYPYITNGYERKKLEETNKKRIEYASKMMPYIPKEFLSSLVELKKILERADINHLLAYDENVKNILLGHSDFIEYIASLPNSFTVEQYYKAKYDSLEFYRRETNPMACIRGTEQYEIKGDILYVNNSDIMAKYSNYPKIVIAQKFIYHMSGIPIIFDKYRFVPKKMNQLPDTDNYKKYTWRDNRLDHIKDMVKSLPADDIKVYEFIEYFLIESGIVPTANELRKYSKEFASYFYPYRREEIRTSEIGCKNMKYQMLLAKLIEEIYSNLTLQEKIYIISHISDYVLEKFVINFVDKDYSSLIGDEQQLLDSLNNKTNGLYNKYKRLMKETYLQYYSGFDKHYSSPGEKVIPKKLVKELKKQLLRN